MEDSVKLDWHQYNYLPYEQRLAINELEGLAELDSRSMDVDEEGVTLSYIDPGDLSLDQLVYFRGFTVGDKSFRTLQSRLEDNSTERRQSTRYSVHGLHEYKGKFNPQVVRGVLNYLGAKHNATVLDPFCGSGTTLVECAHVGFRATGIDINPMAVFLADTKLRALEALAEEVYSDIRKVLKLKRKVAGNESPRVEYLKKWFSEDILGELERVYSAAHSLNRVARQCLLSLASDLLRDYSLQEPADLRIRRRKSPLPEKPILVALEERVEKFFTELIRSQDILGVKANSCMAYQSDVTELDVENLNKFDFAVTSPPYATALPYIDTQRLSLVWLGLLTPKELNRFEQRLTGSRDLTGVERKMLEVQIEDGSAALPNSCNQLCREMLGSLGESDGFRRRAMPALLYRYLASMKNAFSSTARVMKSGAKFALVVGSNRTTLGGKLFELDTPALIADVAVHSGWVHEESRPLETYKRFGLHQANSVNSETLVILTRP